MRSSPSILHYDWVKSTIIVIGNVRSTGQIRHPRKNPLNSKMIWETQYDCPHHSSKHRIKYWNNGNNLTPDFYIINNTPVCINQCVSWGHWGGSAPHLLTKGATTKHKCLYLCWFSKTFTQWLSVLSKFSHNWRVKPIHILLSRHMALYILYPKQQK